MAKLTIYTTTWCPDCTATKQVLDKKGIAYEEIDLEQHPETAKLVEKLNNGKRKVPTLVFDDGRYAGNISPFNRRKLEEILHSGGIS
ncbi:MAG: glutaredoxin family protein [Deinococcus sp.]|nr:glutaredoxin family protein [Deinococcus sp.]